MACRLIILNWKQTTAPTQANWMREVTMRSILEDSSTKYGRLLFKNFKKKNHLTRLLTEILPRSLLKLIPRL